MMILIILLILVSIVLALFVLIQNPKGGGLVSGGSAGTNMFGVKRTGDVLEKGTWVLIALVVVLSLSITTIAKTGTQSSNGSKIQEQLDKTVAPSPIGSNAPIAPAAGDTTKK